MRRREIISLPALPLAAADSKVDSGKPEVPSWPLWDNREEAALSKVLSSGKWGRGGGKAVEDFEKAYSDTTGAKHTLAVANGTSALIVALGALGIGPGDEVIVPPYTFIATVNAVLRFFAVPIFADIDPKTLQIDPKRVEAQITPRTKAIIQVHMAGGVGELGQVIAIGRKHNIPVIEDAAQAHLAEWQGKHVGNHGIIGCFSFQASKNLNAGEGGALVMNDPALWERCYEFHNNSRGHSQPGTDFHYTSSGANLRLTEFQGALLLAQMSRIRSQADVRRDNARRLDDAMAKINGLTPTAVAKDCTRHAYHLYMFHYDQAKFGGRTRAEFQRYLSKLGVPASAGYSPLEKEPFLENTLRSRGYEFAYGKGYFDQWAKRNACPANSKACEETLWFTQNLLLAKKPSMDLIIKALEGWQKA